MKESINKLTSEQSELVSANLDVVKEVIYFHINVNELIDGLGYDDLYQIGCMALCRAAMTYNGSVQFKTYAGVVVRNKLIDHCRAVIVKHRRSYTTSLKIGTNDNEDCEYDDSENLFSAFDDGFDKIENAEALEALIMAKQRYNGITLKGIEAIELKVKGYTGKEIADMYGTSPNLIGAWIARAASRLRKDSKFMASLNEL